MNTGYRVVNDEAPLRQTCPSQFVTVRLSITVLYMTLQSFYPFSRIV